LGARTVLLLAAAALTGGAAASAATDVAAPPEAPAPAEKPADDSASGLGTDLKLYFTAPLRWDRSDWALFGGALLAVGAAHHYDTQVRTHFVKTFGASQTVNSDDVQDALPTAAVLLGTWAYASLVDDSSGRREAWAMLEAAGLGSVSAYALKYAVGREGPDQSSDPNAWRKSGKAFPSEHATAAFAVGTVLAESGNDEYRWLRRLLGYGLGAATSYERLKHDAHWLSDTVAGAALGAASARFSMERSYRHDADGSFGLVPVEGGALLSYSVRLP
jgi:membrane-associated phospholipid phosphatase